MKFKVGDIVTPINDEARSLLKQRYNTFTGHVVSTQIVPGREDINWGTIIWDMKGPIKNIGHYRWSNNAFIPPGGEFLSDEFKIAPTEIPSHGRIITNSSTGKVLGLVLLISIILGWFVYYIVFN